MQVTNNKRLHDAAIDRWLTRALTAVVFALAGVIGYAVWEAWR